MYICICNAVTERQICEAIEKGMCTRKEINSCLRAGTTCGKCNPDIKDLLKRNQPQAQGAMMMSAG